MCKGDAELHIREVREILKNWNITAEVIEPYQKNDRITDYLLDNKFIFRISESVLDEQRKLDRVKTVALIPQIHSSGSFAVLGRNYHFMITDYVQGNDLYNTVQSLTPEQSSQIGKEIAQFLTELHLITDTAYDIGHYVDTIPRYKHSWKEGHFEYIKSLKKDLSEMNISTKGQDMISAAFDYLHTNISCLQYQAGPKLLHNDLHPKNIIINRGSLAGIIDWECSQFGEADFELAHLFHWCIYPPKPENRFDVLLKSLFENFMIALNVPNIEKRLTIYQLEHELNQLIWNGIKQEEERMKRIDGWLNGQIDDLIESWKTKKCVGVKSL